ncbi:MAG: molecular chaperone DnaJ [Candidatus Pacearchaeota archaeon]
MQSVTQSSQKNDEQIQEIINEIQENIYKFEWYISSEKIIKILSLRKEDYYRILYKLKDSHFNPSNLRGFTHLEGHYLCLFLEKVLGSENVEAQFFKAGIFFSKSRESEIITTFQDILNSTLKNHRLDRELLLLLASSTKNFEDAFDSYLDDKLDWDILIERVVNVFINLHTIDPDYGVEEFLKAFLREQMKTNKINLKKITREYKERYYFDLFGESYQRKHKVVVSKEILGLLNFFGLKENATKQELKAKYLYLLKQYHPDVNKNGLEKTKLIIQNYNRLKKLLND